MSINQINRNTPYFGIVFDWYFNNPTHAVPREMNDIYQKFLNTMNSKYLNLSDNILVSKENNSSIVETMFEFKKIIKGFPALFARIKIIRAEIIKFETNGDLIEFLK